MCLPMCPTVSIPHFAGQVVVQEIDNWASHHTMMLFE